MSLWKGKDIHLEKIVAAEIERINARAIVKRTVRVILPMAV